MEIVGLKTSGTGVLLIERFTHPALEISDKSYVLYAVRPQISERASAFRR